MNDEQAWRYLADLGANHGVDLRLEYAVDAPLPYSVWATVNADGLEDIVGAGETMRGALTESRETLERWRNAT